MDHPETIRNPELFDRCPAAGFDGIFDWSWTDGCFGGRITPMDFDGVIERKGNFLVFESKTSGAKVPKGQLITLKQLWKMSRFTICFIWGKKYPEKAQFIYPGNPYSKEYRGVKLIKEKTRQWFLWANDRDYSNEAYDDIEYFNERASILEYEAGYTRKDAEKEARLMMTDRRIRLNELAYLRNPP